MRFKPIRDDGNPIEDILLTGFPNPERSGCPGQDVIIDLANQKLNREHDAWRHIWACSPCYRDYKTLADQRLAVIEKKELRTKRMRWLAAAALTILLAFGVGRLWMYSVNRAGPPPPAMVGNAIMNFATSGNRGNLREATPSNTEVQSYQRERLVLVVSLPPGSDDGNYELQILRTNEMGTPLADVKSGAFIVNGLTIFRAPLDLRNIEPGLYKARVRRLASPPDLPDGTWRSLTIQVK